MIPIDTKNIANNWGRDIIRGIRANIQSSGMTASGEAENSLRIDTEERQGKYVIRVMGASHLKQIEEGRGPTSPGKSVPFVKIRQWVELKLPFPSEGTRDGQAWAVIKKINREGWKPKKRDIVSDPINRANEEIRAKLPQIYGASVRSEVLKAFRI